MENGRIMSLLKLILIVVLQIEGISGQISFVYSRAGDAAIVPCGSDRTCSRVSWIYDRDGYQTVTKVANGKVAQSQAARLSLDASCSLVIKNISTEDVGRYRCQQAEQTDYLTYLSVLTVFRSLPYVDPYGNSGVMLTCTLWRYINPYPGEQITIQWVNDKGTVLPPTQTGQTSQGQKNYMHSSVNVRLQSGHNSRYTCQVFDWKDKTNVKAEASITGETRDDQPGTSKPDSSAQPRSYIVSPLIAGALILMTVVIV